VYFLPAETLDKRGKVTATDPKLESTIKSLFDDVKSMSEIAVINGAIKELALALPFK
jgi:hypothetical protein